MEYLWCFPAPEGKSSYTERVIGLESTIVELSWAAATYGGNMVLGKLLPTQRPCNSITL